MPDFANMTEEEQIAFAMQMSMQDARKLITLHFNLKNIRLNKTKFEFLKNR